MNTFEKSLKSAKKFQKFIRKIKAGSGIMNGVDMRLHQGLDDGLIMNIYNIKMDSKHINDIGMWEYQYLSDEIIKDIYFSIIHNTHIKRIELSSFCFNYSMNTIHELVNMFKMNTSIEEIIIENDDGHDIQVEIVLSNLVANNRIKSIEIHEINDSLIGALSKIIKTCNSLRELTITNLNANLGMNNFIDSIRCNNLLKRINIGNGMNNPDVLAKFIDAIKSIRLKQICIMHNNFGPQHVMKIAELIRFDAVELLRISDNNINLIDAMIIIKSLAQNTSIKTLVLCNNSIGDKCINEIANVLRNNTTLENFNINNCEFSYEALIELADALKTNMNLNSLDINGYKNCYGPACVKHIEKIFQDNKKLKLNINTSLVLRKNWCNQSGLSLEYYY